MKRLRGHFPAIAVLTVTAVLVLAYFIRIELLETGGVLGAPLDDTWIHLVFARNIAQGDGFSFNPGSPTPGSTAPLWTLLLAPVFRFSAAPSVVITYAITLSAIFYWLVVILAYGWTVRLSGSRWVGFLAGLATLSSGRFVWAALSGMEITLFAALTLAALWLYTERRLSPMVALLLGLAGQIRPEAHFLLVVLVAETLFIAWDRKFKGVWGKVVELAHSLWRPLLIYGLITLPYAIFCLATTGHPLPNTFYAKVSGAGQFSPRLVADTLRFFWSDNPVTFLLLPLGLWLLWRHSRPAVLWHIGLPLAYAFVLEALFHYGRYLLPTLPVQMIAAALALQFLGRYLGHRLPRLRPVLQPLFLGLLLAGSAVHFSGWAANLAQNSREVLEIDVTLGEWLAQNTAPDDLIAVDDIGAIGYFSGRRLVDLNGLVSPELWPAVRLAERHDRNRQLARLLSQPDLRPEWVASFPLWRWEIITNPLVAQEIYHVRTETQTIIFQQDAYVHKIDWPYQTAANPQNLTDAVWGEAIVLLGYDLQPPSAGEPLALDFYWQSLNLLDADYKHFVHVVDQDGQIVAQADGHPVAELAPTSVWQPGDIIRDVVVIPDPLPAGRYVLRVGFYLEESGIRLPLAGGTDGVYPLSSFVVEGQ